MAAKDRKHRDDLVRILFAYREGRTDNEVFNDADELLRLAKRASRYAVEACNRELTPREQANDVRNDEKIVTLVKLYRGLTVTIGGDPRGYVVKLHAPGLRGNTWGGDGDWGVA